jgi:trimeric autotransporter adhesin
LGVGNTAIGTFSLFSVTTGNFNTAVGAGSLDLNTADSNTATGAAALLFNTTGTENTAIGTAALEFNETGDINTASGAFALFSNTLGSQNTASGAFALFSNTSGQLNTANGSAALDFNTTGNENTAIGTSALQSNTDGDNNTAIGLLALGANTTGSSNTAVGWNALANNIDGLNNTVIGAVAGGSITTANNVICIGTNLSGENVSNSCYIGHIFNSTSSGGSAVFVNANGRLGTSTSSRRFKDNVKPMGNASETLFSLKPVAFRYKKEIDPAGISQFGLVAEDVEKVNPALIVRDKEGNPYSVRYEAINAMLLNEFLKEHRKVEKLEATIAQQRKDFEAAVAELKGQIQKVSAQLEVSRPGPQTVLNNQ